MIIGDPNTGKSNILENAAKIAPRSVYADNLRYKLPKSICKSKEEITGHSEDKIESFLLEQLICIDHLNVYHNHRKDPDEESYTKQHILQILNSLCPVLAASNPKFDRFDIFKTLSDQMNLSNFVLSKFDLVFVVEDKPIYEDDREIARKFLEIRQKEELKYCIKPDLLKKYIIYENTILKSRIKQRS